MKKIFALLSLSLLLFVIVGCNTTTTTTQTTTTTTTTTSTEAVDYDPVISGADNVTIEKNAGFIPLLGVTATDVEDGDLTDAITYSGNVNPNAIGVYTATYTVVDSAGNITTVNRQVTVVLTDTVAPLLAGIGDVTIFVGDEFDALAGVQANDTIDGDIDVEVEGSVDVWTAGEYELTYTATDTSNNIATQTRTVTVSFGDFAFENGFPFVDSDFVVNGTNLESPVFSGGNFNENVAPHTYVQVVLTISADVAGSVSIALGSNPSNVSTLAVTTTAQEFTVYFRLDAALTDAKIVLGAGSLNLDVSAVVTFADLSDEVFPVLNVPTGDYGYPVGYSLDALKALLSVGITATDNIDGNITSLVIIDWGTLSTTEIGQFDVTYSVSDSSDNVTIFTRSIQIANLVDSGYLSDPTFQNNGDDQWHPKSNDGQASIAYNATDSVMNVTVTSLGGWASAAGAYFSGNSSTLDIDQWYMFTFTVKSSMNRQMVLRMGLQTDQAHGWLDDFDGNATGNLMNLTTSYVTYNYFFKLNSLISSNGSSEFKIELNLGNINYSNVGAGSITSFKDVYLYKLTEEFLPPTFTAVDSAETPTRLTQGSALPDFASYVVAKDMSNNVLDVTYNAEAVNMNTPGFYDVLYYATDEYDNTSEFTLTFEVVASASADTVGPVITVLEGVPTEVDQFTNVQVDFTLLVTIEDAVDGNILVKSSMIDLGGLDFNVAGVYTVTITAWDQSGNTTVETVEITVLDKEAPEINAGAVTLNLGDAFDALAGITVTDNVDGTIPNSSLVITGLDAFLVGGEATTTGKFDVTYTVSDAAGNEAVKVIKVSVVNNTWNEGAAIVLGDSAETHHATVGFDETEQAKTITGIQPIIYSWDVPRLVYYFTPETLVYGTTYKFVITVKATTATSLVFWIGSTLYADPWLDTFDGGDKTQIAITTEYATYEVIFTVDKSSSAANGSKFQFQFGYNALDTSNTIYIQEFKIVPEGVYVPDPTELNIDHIVIEDFLYADEAAFEAAWTKRTNGSNAEDPSDRLQLDATLDAMVLTAPAVSNNGWDLARKYSTLSSLGGVDGYTYLCFYITNNTNIEAGNAARFAIWLYWSGSQNGYYKALPAIGQSGWVCVSVTATGNPVSGILDFAVGFDSWTATPVTGSITVHKVILTKELPTA